MPIASYKELDVWQRSIRLVKEVYRITKRFPSEERFGLVSQTQRAASSISANIAEGWGRGTRKEYVQFLRIARGSIYELETHLTIAKELGYIPAVQFDPFANEIEAIGKMLNRLITILSKSVVSARPQFRTPNP